MSDEEYIPKIAMSIHAHPDDQEFSIGGTLAKWAKAGCEIISVIITSGDSDSNDPKHDASYKPILAELREKEQLAANNVLGIYEPHDPKRLYIHGTDKADTWVDITETLDVKIEALQKHESQVPIDEVGKWITEWAEEEAKDKGMKYAESYKVMIIKKDEDESENDVTDQSGDNR